MLKRQRSVRGDPASDPIDQKQVASERVISAIRRDILSGLLRPGTRIFQEELAAKLGTSRIPIRDALSRLESEGLVTLVPNSGAWISRLDRKECIEIYKIRERLEPLAMGESARFLSDATVAEMQRLSLAMESSGDVDTFLKLDREFHLLSYRSSRMPNLNKLIERFWNSTQQYRRAYAMAVGLDGLKVVFMEHQLLIEALSRRDDEEAARILYGHVCRTRKALERLDGVFEEG